MHPIKAFTLLAILTWACNPKSGTGSSPLKITFQQTESLVLPVNELINAQGYTHYIEREGEEYVAAHVFDGGFNKIFLFDLASQTLTKELRIPAEGPTGTGKVGPVFSLTQPEGHLLIYEQYTQRFHVLSWEGEYVEKIEVPEEKGQVYVAPSLPAHLAEGLLTFHLLPNFHPHTREYLEKAHPLTQISTRTGRLSGIGNFPNYPQALEGSMDVWKVAVTKGLDNHSFVVSFPFYAPIMLLKNGQAQLIQVPASRLNLSGIPALDPASIESHLRGLAHTGWYGYLVTDPYRELYYRVFFPPSEGFSSDGKSISLREKPFEIEVYSRELEWIGSFSFAGGSHNPYSLKVSKKGILLMPLEYPDMEEFIRFDVFVPVF